MSSKFDVIIAGSYSVDLIFSGLSDIPQLGMDIVGTDFRMTPGEAYISAVCMHRLGIKVGWAADFGNDDFSQFAIRCAREEGLDESLFIFHDRPFRRISAAASFPHERGFITYYDPEPQVPAGVQAIIKSDARLLLIPGLYTGVLLSYGKKILRLKKMQLVIDGNSSVGDILGKSSECEAVRNTIRNADIFLPNAREATRITGEQDLLVALRNLGELCPLVVIKDGANGSYALSNGQIVHVPAIKVDPIDTTGAGDSFNAGFLRAWLDHKSVETCLKWGNIVGGLSITELGGTTRKITCDLVQTYLHLQG